MCAAMPTPIAELSTLRPMREKYELLLMTLAEQRPEGRWENTSGRVTIDILSSLPFQTSIASLNPMLNRLAEGDWIKIERRGKRTFSVALLEDPGLRSPEEPAEPPEATEPVSGQSEGDAEDELLGMRPGRFAARIEKRIPEIVDGAVKTAMGELALSFLTIVAGQMGFDPEGSAKLQIVEAELEELRERSRGLEELVRQERQQREFAQTELNEVLRRSPEGKLTTGSLNLHQLPEVYRDLGKHAMANGWKIVRTRGGGHLAWQAADGVGLYYTSTTPSDWRAVRNDKAALERMGLPKS